MLSGRQESKYHLLREVTVGPPSAAPQLSLTAGARPGLVFLGGRASGAAQVAHCFMKLRDPALGHKPLLCNLPSCSDASLQRRNMLHAGNPSSTGSSLAVPPLTEEERAKISQSSASVTRISFSTYTVWGGGKAGVWLAGSGRVELGHLILLSVVVYLYWGEIYVT